MCVLSWFSCRPEQATRRSGTAPPLRVACSGLHKDENWTKHIRQKNTGQENESQIRLSFLFSVFRSKVPLSHLMRFVK
jgi:hypothetical protein